MNIKSEGARSYRTQLPRPCRSTCQTPTRQIIRDSATTLTCQTPKQKPPVVIALCCFLSIHIHHRLVRSELSNPPIEQT